MCTLEVIWKQQRWCWRQPPIAASSWKELRVQVKNHFGVEVVVLLYAGQVMHDTSEWVWDVATCVHVLLKGDPGWAKLGAEALLRGMLPATGLGYYEWPAFEPPRQSRLLRDRDREAAPVPATPAPDIAFATVRYDISYRVCRIAYIVSRISYRGFASHFALAHVHAHAFRRWIDAWAETVFSANIATSVDV
jgi:hypothetical protein